MEEGRRETCEKGGKEEREGGKGGRGKVQKNDGIETGDNSDDSKKITTKSVHQQQYLKSDNDNKENRAGNRAAG